MKALYLHFKRLMPGLQFRTTLLLTFVVLAATGLTAATCLRVSSRITINQTKRHARDIARSLAATTRSHVQDRDRAELLAIAEE